MSDLSGGWSYSSTTYIWGCLPHPVILRDDRALKNRSRRSKNSGPHLPGDLGYHAVQAIPGVGPVLAASLLPRSATSQGYLGPAPVQLGRTDPTHKESDVTVRAGHITKQALPGGWAAVEAVSRSAATLQSAPPPPGGRAPGAKIARWLRPANFSSSSTTPCATARSVLDQQVRPGTDAARCELGIFSWPRFRAAEFLLSQRVAANHSCPVRTKR